MKPPTDCSRYAARLACTIPGEAAMGGMPQTDPQIHQLLAKAMKETAAGLERVSARE